MHTIPDIKLIRTDTTLDLSQKAEKRCGLQLNGHQVHFNYLLHVQLYYSEPTTFTVSRKTRKQFISCFKIDLEL